ncbi:MAG: BlaI/MecI/CopY family transcriptional regulator [Frankiaceae bacterium]|nr:BlaI/MecI/CopY family transcriptional regulator [Frankiaceae bacterium]
MARRGSGELEGAVLAALWSSEEPLTAAAVQTAVGGDLAGTTVMTILARLISKGMATRSREAGERVYRYSPTVGRADHLAAEMYAALSAGADHRAVLARFLGRLDDADRKTAADLLRRKRS